MRIVVAAVGRLKDGPERNLAERYRKRAADLGRNIGLRDIEIIEIRESRAREAEKRKVEESIALANMIPEGSVGIVMDQRGDSLDSLAFASQIRRWQEAGRSAAVFIIGGADGLSASLREQADMRMAFGSATWPHQLVRIMLLEQIYRAATVLSGHPYHRG